MKTQVLTSTHIRRVAVEQVVSHTKHRLLQLVFEARDSSKLAISQYPLHRLVTPSDI